VLVATADREEAETLPASFPAPSLDLGSLPELPEGLNPEVLLHMDLSSLVADEKLELFSRELDQVSLTRAHLDLLRARERVNVLEGEILLELTEARERLRSEGRFVEYAVGEPYETLEGALTAGEETSSGGVRMFYLAPEEFAGIHQKRAEKAAIAERAMRELLARFKGSGEAIPAEALEER
jgi:hypothetical protein